MSDNVVIAGIGFAATILVGLMSVFVSLRNGTMTAGRTAPLTTFAGAGAENPFPGSMGELLLYSRVLTPTEIVTVENYLNAKWGV